MTNFKANICDERLMCMCGNRRRSKCAAIARASSGNTRWPTERGNWIIIQDQKLTVFADPLCVVCPTKSARGEYDI